MTLPREVEINAWLGTEGARSEVDGERFAKERFSTVPAFLGRERVEETDWRNEKVGWGLILPDDSALGNEEKARAVDAPEPIQRLLTARPGAPVFRYPHDWPNRLTHLRRYLTTGAVKELPIVGPEPGIAPGAIPRYLLIYAPPSKIPWDLQFALQGFAFVGRLDLEGDALDNYVSALVAGFGGADATSAVVWGVDHETGDITQLMRRAISERIVEVLRGDSAVATDYLSKAGATRSSLIDRLSARRPALVVTTSHGMTAPLDDTAALAGNLGLLVDSAGAVLDPTALLAAWEPAGAIWYAHACCSAGSDERTAFQGLVRAGGAVERVLRSVAACGSRIAPLPRALLGARRPLRAFIGHVEPTFDATLRDPATGQVTTSSIVTAICDGVYWGNPIARAFAGVHREAGTLSYQHELAMAAYQRGEPTLGQALSAKLTARDRQRLVVLGDPTVAMPRGGI
jgi:hypothetical protein